jgi:type VI protein secretion system component Hcp
MKARFPVTIAIGALLLCWGTNTFAHGIFLQIPGIKGDSVTKGLEGAIEIQSMSWAVSSFNNCSSITVTKVADTATGGLIMATAEGGFVKEARLSMTAPEYAKGSGQPVVFELDLIAPVIESIGIGAVEGAMPTEHINIAFDGISGRTRGFSDGKLLPWVEFKPKCL